MEADLVINLAKLKSHAQMYMTLGVKNLFGTVVGLRKPQWHMRAGVDRTMFAKLLVRIHQAVAPAFTIVDGILALEGQGPGKSGRPRALGLLVGGADAHAVDKTVCTLLGLDPNELLTYRLARELGFFDGDVHVNGDIHIVDDFKFPELHTLSMGPESLNRFMRRYVIQKPVVDNQRCKLCGECWQICPAQVISHNVKGIRFDYQGCIRCYCCLEVCPHGAIQAKEPLLGRLRRRLIQEKPPQELKRNQA
jgi:Pyruvate/2-oxoacid:ferredoxin oxidoreductase delta subunit